MHKSDSWNSHYTRDKSVLIYPDETLVRMMSPVLKTHSPAGVTAVDLGCGTGRHLKYMIESGIGTVSGLDFSMNALRVCSELYPESLLVQGDNTALPFAADSIDFAVAWGSLHYCVKEDMHTIISEIYRVLKPGGMLFGTLRSARDTMLRSGRHAGNNVWITDLKDIRNSVVSFYDEEELNGALTPFTRHRYGIMERSTLGDITRTISHWYFEAVK
ncbi:MAG TPA: class I SAM-dependent methyltransferase [Spirochaetota bacterium]|nr:class I SAM-dependent methyltransferase [Spirochaetota bacterium]HPJ37318.1 class I SAM-dependent methyltransferase [Spirochaetota bacterium]